MSKLIYVVDDEPNICAMMQLFLENEGFTVKTFEDGQAVSQAFSEKKPDMIILDIMMPGIDGLSLCTRFRQKSHVPIIIVSAKDTALDRVTGITLGSDDYITKPFLPLEFVARVKAVFRRSDPDFYHLDEKEPADCFLCGNFMLFPNSHLIQVQGHTFNATPKEFDFLLYMIERKETAVSKRELAEQVWHFSGPHAETDLPNDFIKRLRKKMQAAGSTAFIETVWGFGYQMSTKKIEEQTRS